LSIRIGTNKFDAFNMACHHVLNSVATATAYPNNLDYSILRTRINHFKHRSSLISILSIRRNEKLVSLKIALKPAFHFRP